MVICEAMFSSRRAEIDKGGWIPVLGNQRRIGAKVDNAKSIREGKGNGSNPVFTLFVDNLPEDVSQRWVRYLFNKYGVVKDVYIPGKRSNVTGKLFGFVRYDCEVSANMAISKAHGLWIEDSKLFVKMAYFDQNKGCNDRRQSIPNKNLTWKNSNKKEMNQRVVMSTQHGRYLVRLVPFYVILTYVYLLFIVILRVRYFVERFRQYAIKGHDLTLWTTLEGIRAAEAL